MKKIKSRLTLIFILSALSSHAQTNKVKEANKIFTKITNSGRNVTIRKINPPPILKPETSLKKVEEPSFKSSVHEVPPFTVYAHTRNDGLSFVRLSANKFKEGQGVWSNIDWSLLEGTHRIQRDNVGYSFMLFSLHTGQDTNLGYGENPQPSQAMIESLGQKNPIYRFETRCHLDPSAKSFLECLHNHYQKNKKSLERNVKERKAINAKRLKDRKNARKRPIEISFGFRSPNLKK